MSNAPVGEDEMTIRNPADEAGIAELRRQLRDATFMAALLVGQAGGMVVLSKEAMVAFDGELVREDDFDNVIFRVTPPTKGTPE